MSDIITNTTSTNESKVFNVYVSKSTTAGTALVTRGSLNKTDTAPTVVGLYILEETGVYTNLGNIDAKAGKLNYAYFDGTTWKLIAVDLANESFNDLYDKLYNSGDDFVLINDITWTTLKYVDISGNIITQASGVSTPYKISNNIPVLPGQIYKAKLQAGNLLAVSGWNNGVYNSNLAIVGVDTNNSAYYNFTVPNGVNQIVLTCRGSLSNPTLELFTEDIVEGDIIKLQKQVSNLENQNVNIENQFIFNDTELLGSRTIIGNNTFFGGGKCYFAENIATEDYDFVAKIKVNNLGLFGLCRDNTAGYGTAIVINGNKAEIRKVNTGTGSVIYTQDLPFTIVSGESYILRMYKENKDVIVAICNKLGQYFTYKFIYDSTHDFGRNWGLPTIFCISGSITVENSFLRKGNPLPLRTIAFGDSFIEGWGVIDNLDKRYIAMFQKLMGFENVYISGRGGETTTSIYSRFINELSKYTDVQFVFLGLGTNDSDIVTYKTKMAALISKIREAEKTPILVTVTPRSGYPIAEMNAWVRNSGEIYIDMNVSINNGAETSWNPICVIADNIHPNVLGNQRMFGRMIYDLFTYIDTKSLHNL